MKKDFIAVPLAWNKTGDRFQCEWVRYNYPECFEHKEYPICLSCNQKYVPIDKGDIWCFKCKFTK